MTTIAELLDDEISAVIEANKPGPIREWAAQNGIEVASRGLIPHDVIARFKEAHGVGLGDNPRPVVQLHPNPQEGDPVMSPKADVVTGEPPVQGMETSPSSRAVRAWAHSIGMPVNPRGSVASPVMEAYRAAHSLDTQEAQPTPSTRRRRSPLPRHAGGAAHSLSRQPSSASRRPPRTARLSPLYQKTPALSRTGWLFATSSSSSWRESTPGGSRANVPSLRRSSQRGGVDE